MSFPSAAVKLREGASAEEALLHAIKNDTPLGYIALSALGIAVEHKNKINPVDYIRTNLTHRDQSAAQAVLRFEPRGQGFKVDFDPNSPLAKEIGRLFTDVTRGLIEKEFGMHFGFANCCGVIASKNKDDVKFSAQDQINWQLNPDC